MGKSNSILLPKQQRILQQMGGQIRLARLRRDFTSSQVADRAGIGRTTLSKVEDGDGGVSIGAYLKVLTVLGLDSDFSNIAKDDTLGRVLQDAKLPIKERASKSKR